MGARGWIIVSHTQEQRESIKQWVLDVQRKEQVNWAIRFCRQVKRANGGCWSLIDSDGSGCIDHLENDYGYEGTIMLLGECDWDAPDSGFGRLEDATHSYYIDAHDDEFFPEGDPRLDEQRGDTFLIESNQNVLDIHEAVSEAVKAGSRTLPYIDNAAAWEVIDNEAYYRGWVVENLDKQAVDHLIKQGYSIRGPIDQNDKKIRTSPLLIEPNTIELYDPDKQTFEAFQIASKSLPN